MSAGAASAPIDSVPAKPVDIGKIEHELTALWSPTGPDAQETVTRACMSNLIIFCASPGEANGVSQEMGTISQLHPSRLLLLVGDGSSSGSQLEAFVSAQCYLIGGGRQVCSEHVTVAAPKGGERRLPSVARPLLIGDLPTTLWWVSSEAPPRRAELFGELASMADHVIYDSLGWSDPVGGVVLTADWALGAETEQVASDLTWRRLKPWRRLISQALDPSVVPGALESIREIVIEHGPHALPKSWLLVGWLARRLGWQPSSGKVTPGTEVTWAFQSKSGPVSVTIRRLNDGESEIRNVTIGWTNGTQSESMHFGVVGAGRFSVTTGRSSEPLRVVTSPPQPRASLVARQLPDLGRDLLFLETLDVARTMAKALQRT